MIWIVCAMALASGAQDPRIEDLDNESAELRDAAAKRFVERGPSTAASLLEHHRKTSSAEVRGRIEEILLHFPFAAYVLTRPGDAIRERLESHLLEPLKDHREIAACWKERDGRNKVDPARLRIVWQEGSGHGQMLRVTWLAPDDAGGSVVRRLTYQGTTPYRPKVVKAGVSVEEARLGAAETSALASLLEKPTALRSEGCAIPRDPGKYVWSSASFSVRLRIVSGDVDLWSSGYTGYPGDGGRGRYAHARAVESVFEKAMKSTEGKSVDLLPQDRAKFSAWILANFETEEWWIREHFLRAATYAGDESLLPLLRKIAETPPKDDPSDKRQVDEAREALNALEAARK